ncbi:MAG: hypothetical protein WDA23_05750 [Gemmobacter sp.]
MIVQRRIRPEDTSTASGGGKGAGTSAAILGVLVLALMVMQGLIGWFGLTVLQIPSIAVMLAVLPLMVLLGSRTARSFIALSAAVFAATLLLVEEPWPVVHEGITRALHFQAFVTAVFTLQEPALRSAMLRDVGLWLLSQPLRRRYTSIMLGTHLLALMMNLGSLVLIGSIAQTREGQGTGDSQEHALDRKQIPLAAIRGFSPSSMWSPLALPPAFVASFYPEVPILTVMVWGFGLSILMLAFSYLVMLGETRATLRRTAMIPASAAPRPPVPVGSLVMLALTVTLIFGTIETAARSIGMTVSTAVIFITPAAALIWLAIQCRGRPGEIVTGPGRNIVRIRLPQQTSETVVIVAAAFMGPMLLALLPFDNAIRLFGDAPVAPVFACLVFLGMVGTGLAGFNPVLTATVAVAVAGDPRSFGLDPLYLILIILTGWALTAQFSPFTTTSIVAARMFDTTPQRLTLVWNGMFFVLSTSLVALVILGVGFLA